MDGFTFRALFWVALAYAAFIVGWVVLGERSYVEAPFLLRVPLIVCAAIEMFERWEFYAPKAKPAEEPDGVR